MHDDGLCLGAIHQLGCDDVIVLHRFVLGLVCEPLSLDARDIEHIQVGNGVVHIIGFADLLALVLDLVHHIQRQSQYLGGDEGHLDIVPAE